MIPADLHLNDPVAVKPGWQGATGQTRLQAVAAWPGRQEETPKRRQVRDFDLKNTKIRCWILGIWEVVGRYHTSSQNVQTTEKKSTEEGSEGCLRPQVRLGQLKPQIELVCGLHPPCAGTVDAVGMRRRSAQRRRPGHPREEGKRSEEQPGLAPLSLCASSPRAATSQPAALPPPAPNARPHDCPPGSPGSRGTCCSPSPWSLQQLDDPGFGVPAVARPAPRRSCPPPRASRTRRALKGHRGHRAQPQPAWPARPAGLHPHPPAAAGRPEPGRAAPSGTAAPELPAARAAGTPGSSGPAVSPPATDLGPGPQPDVTWPPERLCALRPRAPKSCSLALNARRLAGPGPVMRRDASPLPPRLPPLP